MSSLAKNVYHRFIMKIMYHRLCRKRSDINEHLPTLFAYARTCTSVLELGVRGCVSSWALLYGLTQNETSTPKKLLLNDIETCDIDTLLRVSASSGVSVTYEWINDLHYELKHDVDMTFIDTWHVYGQLRRELERFAPQTRKYIIMHDTTVDGKWGESVRIAQDTDQLAASLGWEKSDVEGGLWQAVEEFLQHHPEWSLRKRYINNNGLAILERKETV